MRPKIRRKKTMTGFGRPSKKEYDYGGGCSNCGNPRDGTGRYCLACHALWMRLNRPKHSDLPPAARLRANARAYANVYLRRGKIKREPCKVCACPDSQMHHPDYSKPLEIEWFCRRHHLDLHQEAA